MCAGDNVHLQQLAYCRLWLSLVSDHPNSDPTTIFPDGRFSHVQQVNDRLRFLRFLLKDGQLWLCKQQATEARDGFHTFL